MELKRCTLSCPNPNSIIKHSREVSFPLLLFVHALSISSPPCHLSIECDAISDQVTPSKASNKTHSTVHFNSLLLAPPFHFTVTLTCSQRICMRRRVQPIPQIDVHCTGLRVFPPDGGYCSSQWLYSCLLDYWDMIL